MKLLIVSDIHGSGYYANKLLEIVEKENPDKIVLLGDLYYHGPRNPLTEKYGPMEVANILNSLKDKILAIKGNCDAEVDEMISEFPLQENIQMKANGYNLFTITGLDFVDPERTSGSYGYLYPIMRNFNFGLNLSF